MLGERHQLSGISKERQNPASLPSFFIIRGIPGAGKSTVSELLRQRIGQDQCLVLDPDDIMLEADEYDNFCQNLSEAKVSEKYWPYRYLVSKAIQGLSKNRIILWNQAWTKVWGIDAVLNTLNDFLPERCSNSIVIGLDVDVSIAETRIRNRGKELDERSLGDFVENFEQLPDGWRPQLRRLNMDTSTKEPEKIADEILEMIGISN